MKLKITSYYNGLYKEEIGTGRTGWQFIIQLASDQNLKLKF